MSLTAAAVAAPCAVSDLVPAVMRSTCRHNAVHEVVNVAPPSPRRLDGRVEVQLLLRAERQGVVLLQVVVEALIRGTHWP